MTIVIPCKDDPKIASCLRSIDTGVYVLAVCNGSPPGYPQWLRTIAPTGMRLTIHDLPRPNLSVALETGVRLAPTDEVLFMDSDCTFAPGAVEAFRAALREGANDQEVYKGRVQFLPGTTFVSQVIARSRQHHTAEQLTAYKPPLALHRSVLPRIGGYAFDPRLPWREDADLDARIRAAGVSIAPVPEGVIFHDPLTLRTDLRSTFRYGMGEAIADQYGISLTDVPRSVWSTFRSQGALTAAYMAARNRVYSAGYLWGRATIHRH